MNREILQEASPTPSGPVTLRRKLYELIQSPEIETPAERYVRAFITILIVVNVVAVMMETMREVRSEYIDLFSTLEVISVGIFTIEYLVRLWVIVEDPMYAHPVFGRLRYIFSFFALIDLVAILPFYLPVFIPIDLRTLRMLRLLRLTRLIKLGRYSRAASVFRAIFVHQREELVMSMGVMLLLLVVSSTMIYYLEHQAQPEHFSSIPASLWWGIVTLTTIGYGDVYPITVGGKVCAALISVLSIGMVALPSGIIVSGFVEEMKRKDEEEERMEELMAARHPHHPTHGYTFCPHCGERLPEIERNG